MRYFVGKDGKQLGPFDAQQIRDQLNAGLISYDDLIWREGMPAWAPVRTEFPPPGIPPVPPQADIGVPPLGTAPTPSPFHAAGSVQPVFDDFPQLAGRGRRLGAALLDTFLGFASIVPGVIWLVSNIAAAADQNIQVPEEPDLEFLLQFGLGPIVLMAVPMLILLLVQAWLLSTRGQSIGKKILRIRIVRTNGAAAGFTHAFLLRSFVMHMIGSIPVVGGVISFVDPLLIFREDRRCIHDLIAGTIVVDE